jgi:hypothetical protein
MKPVYTTLKLYNEDYHFRPNALVECPAFGPGGDDNNVLLNDDESDDDVHNEQMSSPLFFEIELDGTSFVPEIHTRASGNAFVLLTDALYIFLRISHIQHVQKISIVPVSDNTLVHHDEVILHHRPISLHKTHTFFIPLDHVATLRPYFKNGDVALVVATAAYPKGEIAGFFDVLHHE